MRSNFTIICDNAFTDKEDRLTIIQVFTRINAVKFPALHPRFTIVTNFSPEKTDLKKEFNHAVVITNPDGKEIIKAKTPSWVVNDIGKDFQFIHYFTGIIFEKEGRYTINITINNESKNIKYLDVSKE